MSKEAYRMHVRNVLAAMANLSVIEVCELSTKLARLVEEMDKQERKLCSQ